VAALLRRLDALRARFEQWFRGLTPLQQTAAVVVGLASLATAVLSIIYHDTIFHWLGSFAKSWRSLSAGWLLLWMLTFIVCFPPLVGYSTAVMLGGFVYGFPMG
jgi:hypothetical protein